MTLCVKVSGGTNAGCRRVRERESWACRCVTYAEFITVGGVVPEYSLRNATGYFKRCRLHSGDRYSCPGCGERRPT